MNKEQRIVISGTHATGKTTLAMALERITGIPIVRVNSMEELASEHFSGKSIEQCSPYEYYQVCIYRLLEQAMNEHGIEGSFIVDGSLIEFYIYSLAKLNSLACKPFDIFENKLGIIAHKSVYKNFYESLGKVLKEYCMKNYHSFIHLPVESSIETGSSYIHSNKFRKTCDEMLITAIEEIGIQYYIITGSLEERLKKILHVYDITPIMSIEGALKDLGNIGSLP